MQPVCLQALLSSCGQPALHRFLLSNSLQLRNPALAGFVLAADPFAFQLVLLALLCVVWFVDLLSSFVWPA
jgi:hypothetical protein